MRLDEITQQQPAVDRQAIIVALADMGIERRSTINADGSVDVNGDVNLSVECKNIPVQFNKVHGTAWFNETHITSLKGSPKYVTKDFWCDSSPVTTLKYAPQYVGGLFACSYTNITSLEYAPQHVDKFSCTHTKITSLKGAPAMCRIFSCDNTTITSLEYAPQRVDRFSCTNTNITSLHNIHKTHPIWEVGTLTIPRQCTHVLGLALMEGVKKVQFGFDTAPVEVIHDMFEWQEKLLEMGLIEQAQL